MKPSTLYIAGGVAVLGIVGLYVWRKGGVANAAQATGAAVGAGVVNAAGGAVSGAVGAVGASVGLPTPTQTTTDAAVARWLIDNAGHFEASKWAGAPAYLKALFMEPGTGTPPPAGSDAAREFAGLMRAGGATDTGDETARLLARYPAPADRQAGSIFAGVGSFSEGAAGTGYFDLLGVRDPQPLY